MKLTTLVIAAALATGCVVHNDERSFIVGTKLIPETASNSTPVTCVYDATSLENAFGNFDPAAGYVHAIVVENRLPDNTGLGPGRIATNDFQVEGATITTEVLIGPAQSIPTQTVPANGLIKINTALPVAIVLAQPGAIADGSTVRFGIQVFGHLIDGSSVKSNRYEYSALARTGTVAGPVPNCTAPAAPVACEGARQDTTVVCL